MPHLNPYLAHVIYYYTSKQKETCEKQRRALSLWNVNGWFVLPACGFELLELAAVRKQTALCLKSVLSKVTCTDLPLPNRKGEPWHLLTCRDYVALTMIDSLACLKKRSWCVLCANRARLC